MSESSLDEDREDDGRVITFESPIIGFPLSRRFALHQLGEAYGPFATLSSLDEEGLGFIVVPPGVLFDDYVIEVPEAEATVLGLLDGSDVEVLTLVTRRVGSTPTVNLMGPVVVNRRTDRASQVVLQDGTYTVAVPVDAPSAKANDAFGAASADPESADPDQAELNPVDMNPVDMNPVDMNPVDMNPVDMNRVLD